jgi:hypothetical protein
MKADALAIAAPDFELLPGDEIHIDVRSCDGVALSSVTFEDPFFAIDVAVWRPVGLEPADRGPGGVTVFRWLASGQCYITAAYRCYLGDQAREFMLDLMKRGSR